VTGPKVDFYLLADTEPRARLRTACRLTEKAFDQGHRVVVRTSGAAETAELDELLWTFSDRSFVPHSVWPCDADLATETPVLIGSGDLPDSHRDVLVNLGEDAPSGFADFARVLEVVGADDASKAQARSRWRRYRESGAIPESHNL
jgi:DNA polymerase III subunit chi